VLKFSENFLKFEKSVFVFILICCNFDTNEKFRLRDIFRKMRNIKNYNNIFDSKNIFIFFDYKKKNYSIDLLSNKKFFYRLLYFFFEKNLDILQKYFLKNLTLNRIRKSISSVDISILFVSKNNSSLRLYIDYRNFNIITIKNKYSLFLIEKTLNRLINAVYFTKLDFKNTYYQIRIRQDNK